MSDFWPTYWEDMREYMKRFSHALGDESIYKMWMEDNREKYVEIYEEEKEMNFDNPQENLKKVIKNLLNDHKKKDNPYLAISIEEMKKMQDKAQNTANFEQWLAQL
jgi:hypothetical protein